MSTVLLMDPGGRALRPAAGPRVPGGWARALGPVRVGPNMGSCGTAAFRKERVVIADIASDPLRPGGSGPQSREAAIAHGLRASWSQPLVSGDGEVLGTFAMYYGAPRTPD